MTIEDWRTQIDDIDRQTREADERSNAMRDGNCGNQETGEA